MNLTKSLKESILVHIQELPLQQTLFCQQLTPLLVSGTQIQQHTWLKEECVLILKHDKFVKAKTDVKMSPGEMLKTIRELQELSQKELAKLAGMTQSNISALENEVRQIGRERAIALARALKVHPAVILFPDFELKDVT